MSGQFDFSGPFLKVERADKHIREVETLLGRFVSDNKDRLRPENQQRALKAGRIIRTVDPPKHFPTALGDAIHNLRASLDHAYCILIEANGHQPTEHSKFPFCKDAVHWPSMEGSVNGHIKAGNGPSILVLEHIGLEVQPYPGGKHRLFDLHKLDIADKHHCILPTTTELFSQEVEIRNPQTGVLMGVVSGLSASNNDMGAFSTNQFVVSKDNFNTAFDVTFGKGQPLEGERIIPTLGALRDSVVLVLTDLSRFL